MILLALYGPVENLAWHKGLLCLQYCFYLSDLGDEFVHKDDTENYKFADDGTLRVTGISTTKCLYNCKCVNVNVNHIS